MATSANKISLSIFVLFILVLLPVTVTAVYDPPHNEASGVFCAGCHGRSLELFDTQGNSIGSPFWENITADEAYNAICLRCHVSEPNVAEGYGGESAPLVKSHAPGGSAIKCTVCHNNHEQEQIYPGKYNQGEFFVATGFVDSIDPYDSVNKITTIYYSALNATGNWVDLDSLAAKTGENRGAMLVPNISDTSSRWSVYMIDSIDPDPDNNSDTTDGTITVKGEVTSAANLGIFYGQLIKSMMRVDNQTRFIEFYDTTGTKSFTRSSSPYGICQICHEYDSESITGVKYWAKNGEGQDHNPGKDCLGCHAHNTGFVHGSGEGTVCSDCHDSGNHVIHLDKGKTCEQCHGAELVKNGNGDVQFADNELLADTTVCITCHNSKPGWGDNATACLSCHQISQGSRNAVGQQLEGNSHHIQDVAVDDSHCYECHWEAAKVDGVVTGKIDTSYHAGEALPGSEVDLVIYGAGSRPTTYDNDGLNDNDTAIQYIADGSRNQIEILNDHCLGCHDDDTRGVDVFGDSKSPNYYAWDESSTDARDGSSVNARYSQSGTTLWGKYNAPSYTRAPDKKLTKAFSAHGNATTNQGGNSITRTNNFFSGESWPNTRNGSNQVVCFDCHNSHGSNVSGATTSYNSSTANGGILKSTTAGKGGYGMDYSPTSGGTDESRNLYNAGADLCFDCHLTETAGQKPWGYNSTFGATAPVKGFADSDRFGNDGDYRGTHAGGHFGASMPLSTPVDGSINGLCTPCHDPHGVSPTLNQDYAVPILKGTWMASPYKLDSPKYHPGQGYKGAMQASNKIINPPLYNIDQNSFANWDWNSATRISETVDNFGGLCLKCHPKTSIDADASSSWRSVDRVHETVKGWGGNNKHSFPCGKCHTPHATGQLPRLMITNCLDNKHKGRLTNNLNPELQNFVFGINGAGQEIGGHGSFSGGGQKDTGAKIGFGLGINCHTSTVTGPSPNDHRWNNVTPWLDIDEDKSISYPLSDTAPYGDCDDTDPTIFKAADRTCDGDNDGFIDATAGGTDCDDNDSGVDYVPAICDQDGDSILDPAFGGYDCDDSDIAIGAAADGYCDGDGDGGIDWTAGGTDCTDNDPNTNSTAADGTCDGDNDGYMDYTAGGVDCDDNDANIVEAADGSCDGDNDGLTDMSVGGTDCDDDSFGIGAAADSTCDGDSDGYIDWQAGGDDCQDDDPGHIALDGSCDGDNDGFVDASADGTDCDDNDNGVGYVTAICDVDEDGLIALVNGGYDCLDTDASVTVAYDGTCDGDADTFIDWTAGSNDCDDENASAIPVCDITGNSTSYTVNTVTNYNANWPPGYLVGKTITYHVTYRRVTGGSYPFYIITTDEYYDTKTIVGNTATTITVSPGWNFAATFYTPKEYVIPLN